VVEFAFSLSQIVVRLTQARTRASAAHMHTALPDSLERARVLTACAGTTPVYR